MDDYLKTVERRLKRFPPEEAKVLAEWLQSKPIGINLALQFLEQISDLKTKTGQGAAVLLQELLEEVSAKDLHSKELGRRLRDAVERRLHPQRHAHEAAFEAWQQRLVLPPKARIKAPQNFEGKTFTLQLEFTKPEDLRLGLEALLQSLEKRDLWEEMYRF